VKPPKKHVRKKPGRWSIKGDLERSSKNRDEIMRMAEEGVPLRLIADRVGLDVSRVWRIKEACLNEVSKVVEGRAKHIRALELSRLDRIMRGLWKAVDEGDPESGRTLLKVMERRARLLGLDLQPEAAPLAPVTVNFMNFNDPRMQIILNSPAALEILQQATEIGTANESGHADSAGGGNGLAVVPGNNGTPDLGGRVQTLPPHPAD